VGIGGLYWFAGTSHLRGISALFAEERGKQTKKGEKKEKSVITKRALIMVLCPFFFLLTIFK